MGSSIQIALFVTPILVLSSGLFAPAALGLEFSRLEIGTLFLGTLIVYDRRRRAGDVVQGRPAPGRVPRHRGRGLLAAHGGAVTAP